jgi:hypothetical protein
MSQSPLHVPLTGRVPPLGQRPATSSGGGGGGGGADVGPLLFAGAVNEEVTDFSDTTYVVGGIVIDPSLYASAPTFRFFGVLSGSSPTNAELTLVDLGAPGSPAAGVVRSTATIPGASVNQPTVVDVSLTVVAAPGVDADEVFDEERMYELRLALDGASGDSAIVRWGGVVIP